MPINTRFDLYIDLIRKEFELIDEKTVRIVLDNGEEKFYYVFVFKDGFNVVYEIGSYNFSSFLLK